MKKVLILTIAAFALVVFASTASAQTYRSPCYDWDCISTPSGTCDFDSTSCSSGGGAWFFSWDFGDGTTLPWSTNQAPTHFYAGGHTANVTLTIHYFGPKADESATCSVQYRNIIGPPGPLTGRCP
ncbi:MAG: PKD domain-containing protein [Acidobacteriota bacterium]